LIGIRTETGTRGVIAFARLCMDYQPGLLVRLESKKSVY
jgi:hypothetical protein